jgi:hypothetical protein
MGRASLLCPRNSDIYLFRYGKGIIHLDTKISDGAFYSWGMSWSCDFLVASVATGPAKKEGSPWLPSVVFLALARCRFLQTP